MGHRFYKRITTNPKKFLLITVQLTLFFIPGLLFLNLDFGIENWFRKDDANLLQFNYFKDTFGSEDSIFLVAEAPSPLFDPQTLKILKELEEDLWNIEGIERIDSLRNYPIPTYDHADDKVLIKTAADHVGSDPIKLKNWAQSHSLVPGYLMGNDGHSSHFNIRLKEAGFYTPTYPTIFELLEELLARYEQKYKYRFHMIGTATATEKFRKVAFGDMFVMMPIMIMTIAGLFIFIFRNVYLMITPFLVVILTISATMGLAGFFGITLNNLSAMVPSILLAITMADAIHLLVTYVENIKKKVAAKEAALTSLKENFIPTVLTTISTSIGFFSLTLSDIAPMQDLGLLCGLGCLLAWCYSYLTLIPMVLLLEKRQKLTKVAVNLPGFSPKKMVRTVRNYPKLIVAITTIFTLLFVFVGTRNEINSNVFDYFDPATKIWQSNEFIKKTFGGFNGIDIVLETGTHHGVFKKDFLTKLESFEVWVEQLPGVNKMVSIADFIKPLNQAFHKNNPEHFKIPDNDDEIKHQFLYLNYNAPPGRNFNNLLNPTQSQLRSYVLWNVQKSEHALKLATRIEHKIKEMGLKGYVTGREYLFNGINKYLVVSFYLSIGTTVLLISLGMTLYFKSLRLGLLSILPNIIPLTFGGFLMSLMGRPIDVGTVLVASVCFGIAIDDTIHIMVSYRESKNANDNLDDRLHYVFSHAGKSIITTTMILVFGFGTFFFAKFIPNWNFGVFSACLMLMALVVDLFMLPALFTFIHKPKRL